MDGIAVVESVGDWEAATTVLMGALGKDESE
jgi:hypothetical protein